MSQAPAGEKVRIRCLCGLAHNLSKTQVLDGLARKRRKCSGCKRRFILFCTPAEGHHHEKFSPMFLEDVPSMGDTQEMAISADGPPSTAIPKKMPFQCACGCRLVAVSRMYGRKTRCPKCGLRIVPHLTYNPDDGKPVLTLEFPDRGKN